jgi:bifunctional DNA-binding transcriptional regulator/antitoxin component of YhaV-PrlF toxin-antitoxin module
MERLVGVVHGFSVSRSLVVVVPAKIHKELNIEPGDCLSVKIDDRKRIIYEFIERLKKGDAGTKQLPTDEAPASLSSTHDEVDE